MSGHARVAVLASGGGTNLQSLADRLNGGESPHARVELVVGSREGIGALARVERAGIPRCFGTPCRGAVGGFPRLPRYVDGPFPT